MVRKFSTTQNIENPDLRDPSHPATWQDTLTTGILIESVFRWRGDLVEKRPALLLTRNAYRNLRIIIGDRVSGANGRGFDQFTTLWVGSHTVFCIHGSGASCEILATEVQREFTEFGPEIAQKFGFKKFQVLEVSEIGIVEESVQNFGISINIGWAYEESWKLEPDSLPLTGVIRDTNV